MHGIIQHPGNGTWKTSIDSLNKSICHICSIHIIINKHLRIFQRGVNFTPGSTNILLLIQRISLFHKFKTNFSHHDFLSFRNLLFIGSNNICIFSRINGDFRRISMDIVKFYLFVQLHCTAIYPSCLRFIPDGNIRTDDTNFSDQVKFFHILIKLPDRWCPKRKTLISGSPITIRLIH